MAQTVMKIAAALQQTTRLFLDTAPVIYYIEAHPHYIDRLDAIFDVVDQYELRVLTSPVTLAESLVLPYRLGLPHLQQSYTDFIVNGPNTYLAVIDGNVGRRAAELRARYHLTLPDSFQLAVALSNGCDAFLTNDDVFRRVTELRMLILDDLTL